ncbi:flagellin [Rhizobium leguminosarum]|uniref:flagellin N-terminal helical domain-containing protein n=1 Tax=Rhizobium leguminosarum TaxID=384 RepID=UPI002E1135B8|nr:flagellin [Rhizobium leguminosarum]WSH76835.1 flagellin [Rhizobium leguminosarum]
MTSITTNTSAMAALQTLRTVGSRLTSQQMQVSSGLRIATASDNAAYWSIATTMRSDRRAVSAANDALGVGAAKVDTAYAAMDSVVEVLSEFKAKLVAAKEKGIDLDKIQSELDQLKSQVLSISQSASFNGQNWLNTDIEDIYDPDINKASVVGGFTRNADGMVSVNSIDYSMLQSALFNSTGGGMLQADPRDMKTIGGLRFDFGTGVMSTYSLRNTGGWGPTNFTFDFSSPMTFGAGDSMSFDVTVDQDNPADGISAPYDPGKTTSVVIDAARINTALGRSDGTINNYKEYAAVLRSALGGSGLTATTYTRFEPPGQSQTWVDIPDVVGIVHYGVPTKDGSSMAISNVVFNGVTQANQIAPRAVEYGTRNSEMTLDFEPFTVYKDVVISMRLRVDGAYSNLSFDKDFVDQALGKDNGKVETSAEMATLLAAVMNRPDMIVEATNAGTVTLKTDPLVDRKSGEKSMIAIDGINVNIEPLPTMNFMDVDVARNPDMIDGYLAYIEAASGRVIAGTAALGSLQTRIEMQSNFAKNAMDTIDKGVGRLVDADMEEASAKLSALQTQQQLALQGLQISNQAPDRILSLFNF